MRTATSAKRRHNAEQLRGIHPEANFVNNNNGRESLKSKIKRLNGEAILGSVNLFTKFRKSLHAQLCTLNFLKRCRDHQVVPKFLQLKNPFCSKQTNTILRQASLKLVKERITFTKRHLAELSRQLLDLHLFLSSSLDPQLWETLDRVTHEQAIRTAEMKTETQKRKFQKLIPQDKTSVLTHTVKNLSKHQLSEAQVSVLAKGYNFAVAPKKIPTEEIISRIETAIYHLPQETGNEIRRQLSNILHKVTLPVDNINREKRLALRSLKGNDKIVILLADKGNATVVMDKV